MRSGFWLRYVPSEKSGWLIVRGNKTGRGDNAMTRFIPAVCNPKTPQMYRQEERMKFFHLSDLHIGLKTDEPGSAGGSALYFPTGDSTGGKGAAGCYRGRRGYL